MAEPYIKDRMGNYRIRVKIEIEECGETEVTDLIKEKDGSFEMRISEEEAVSIDRCEKAFLMINHVAIRDAISNHFTEVSKKKR